MMVMGNENIFDETHFVCLPILNGNLMVLNGFQWPVLESITLQREKVVPNDAKLMKLTPIPDYYDRSTSELVPGSDFTGLRSVEDFTEIRWESRTEHIISHFLFVESYPNTVFFQPVSSMTILKIRLRLPTTLGTYDLQLDFRRPKIRWESEILNGFSTELETRWNSPRNDQIVHPTATHQQYISKIEYKWCVELSDFQ